MLQIYKVLTCFHLLPTAKKFSHRDSGFESGFATPHANAAAGRCSEHVSAPQYDIIPNSSDDSWTYNLTYGYINPHQKRAFTSSKKQACTLPMAMATLWWTNIAIENHHF